MQEKYRRNPGLTEEQQQVWDAINLPTGFYRVGDMLVQKILITPTKRTLNEKYTVEVADDLESITSIPDR